MSDLKVEASLKTPNKRRILHERKRLNFTQEQISEKCGIRRQQWIRYEKGESVLDGKVLRCFVAYGADLQYLVTGERKLLVGDEVLREDFGVRVAEERERLGFTQQDVADRCFVSRVQWGRYERGEQYMSPKVLRHFEALGANAVYILNGINEANKIVDTSIHDRFKESRLKLNLSQQFVADVCEVSVKTVSRWESSINVPSDKLLALSAYGFDVQYIIVGSAAINGGVQLNDTELGLIMNYRLLNDVDRDTVSKILAIFKDNLHENKE